MLNRLFRRKASDAPKASSATQEADRFIQLGQPIEDRGEIEEALELYRRAVSAAPSYSRPYMNAGHALIELKRWREAEAAYRKAVECAPDYAPARFNLGQLLLTVGTVDEGEQHLLAARRLQPTLVEAHIVLADLYETLGRFEEAEAEYNAAAAMTPTHPGALLNFGIFCLGQGRLDEAAELFAKARAADPGLRDAESAVLFALNFRTDLDAAAIAARHREVGRLFARNTTPQAVNWGNAPDPDRRLRVGYVSGDFFLHPVALFLQAVLPHHRSQHVTTYCYSNYHTPNPIADSIRAQSQHWCDVHAMNDAQMIERIHRDEIDILVDLSGHTNRNRLHAFAAHPAPVQMTWLGYLNTTGLEAMDYRICDGHTDPVGTTEPLYTEKLIRMPDSQWCYAPWHRAEAVAEPHPDRPDAIVFGSFNQLVKISDACFEAWARIVSAVPQATMVILDVRQPAAVNRMLERAARYGIDRRVELRGRESIPNYYAALGNADIGLDTFPYNGATTTLDALWMGVPVVALRGERSISRSAYSIMKTLGADELIAETLDEYIEINIRLAKDREWRSSLRRSLRHRLETSPLMDGPRFVAALESRYRAAWHAWCHSTRVTD